MELPKRLIVGEQMEFMDSPAKMRVLETFVKNRGKSIGIIKISQLSNVSVSAVWRQIPALLRYGIIVERQKGKKYRIYTLDMKNQLTKVIVELYTTFEKTTMERARTVRYEELKRAKSKKFGRLAAVMDKFEAKRGGGRPKSREEILALATMAREAWKRAEASGRLSGDGGLKVNVD